MRKRAQQGFVLLEVIIAFVIMGMALGVLYESVGGGLAVVARAERKVRAAELAQSVLSLRAAVPKGGWNESGVFDDMRWEVRSAPYAIDTQGFQLPWRIFRVEVWVGWEGGAEDYRLVTLMAENPNGE